MKRFLPLAALFAFPAAAQQADPPTPASIVAEATAAEWVSIAPEDLLVMDLAPDAEGRARRVVIQLMPPPFSQPWVTNIRTLARAHWWDGKSVYRVVDNWVTQWGGGDPELGMDPGPLPDGVTSPVAPYAIQEALNPREAIFDARTERDEGVGASSSYADWESFYLGWPVAGGDGEAWPVHCYGHVGVARDLAPDTGTGSELYAVIGHAPRQLDRNIAVVGRVIAGIEHLSVLPRGTGDAGVYEDRAQDTPIVSVRLASELADPPRFEYLDTASESFGRYITVRANRQDDFYQIPAGGVDICNVQLPLRPAGQE